MLLPPRGVAVRLGAKSGSVAVPHGPGALFECEPPAGSDRVLQGAAGSRALVPPRRDMLAVAASTLAKRIGCGVGFTFKLSNVNRLLPAQLSLATLLSHEF